jgi:hypothetical protein
VAWTSAAEGSAPFLPSKLYRVVKVCAGRASAVIAHSTKIAYARFPRFSLANSLAIRFIDVLAFFTRVSIFGGRR